ncbi:S-layer homology domain-containing protein [Solibacillus sp. FSL W8-0474]|uniref:S-layer homology domain-containing protein n=1 Tax=Solibacillus sp. FSL W8-0474 TaxID=2975336 RepID=UPI0030FAD9DB
MKKNTRFLASATAVVLASTAIVPVASAASFSDIKGSGHENAITSLSEQGIIGGYPDGTFKPNQNLTRSDVVKLLGKYLVSLGHKVPEDYKTKMRFTDLTAKSQDELLQYAALVKDVGVFQGSNGALMHRDQLRRDQMATVLVRAFKVINEYDYVAPMLDSEYKSNISDLHRTTVEHQESIETLAYYGVTKQKTFNPKDPTKRGQFATFLYNMLQIEVPKPEPEKPVLTIKTVEVQAVDKLRVVLSDDKAYIVSLKTPLVENVETEVTFEVEEQSFTTKVKFEVPDLKISSVTNPNGGQIAITFNQPVKMDTEINTAAINKLVAVTGIDRLGQVQLLKGQLSEDKRTLTVTINATTGLEGRYRVVVDGVESATAKKLIKYDDIATLVADKTAPAVLKSENISATKAKVIFSEPIKKSYGTAIYKLANGTPVLNVKEGSLDNVTEVTFDLSAATANGRILDPGTTVHVTFPTILDITNNLSSPNPLTAQITKGNKDGIVPTIANVTQLGAKKFKLTFTEEIRLPLSNELAVVQGNINNAIDKIEQDTSDAKSVIVTTKNALTGSVTISTKPGYYITDLSGEVNTFSTAFNFTVDTTVPTVIATNVVKDQGIEYLEFTFDRNIETPVGSKVSITGSYILSNLSHPIKENFIADVQKSSKQDNVARVKLSNLLNETDLKNYTNYIFSVNANFAGVRSEHGQIVNNVNNFTFTRGYDSVQTQEILTVRSVETSTFPNLNNSIPKNTMVITFNTNVDPALARNISNYSLGGIPIKSADVRVNEQNKVYLEIQPGTIAVDYSEYLIINNLRAANSTVQMAPYTQLVGFKENIAPTISSITANANVNTNTHTLLISFSEPVENVNNNAFNININGTIASNIAIYPINNNNMEYMVVLQTKLNTTDSVTVYLSNNSVISDKSGNKLELLTPYSVPVWYQY